MCPTGRLFENSSPSEVAERAPYSSARARPPRAAGTLRSGLSRAASLLFRARGSSSEGDLRRKRRAIWLERSTRYEPTRHEAALRRLTFGGVTQWVEARLLTGAASVRIRPPPLFELEVFVGGMPDSYSVRRGFDSLQAHSFVGLMYWYIATAVNRRSEGSIPSPTATTADPSGERDSFVTRRGGFDSRGQLHDMARVLLVRRSGFHPGSAGIVTPARHPDR